MNDLKEHSIKHFIYKIRSENVILDYDLAKLYQVETRVLKQTVRRNIKRFPEDFMFELNDKEDKSLRSQTVILKRGQHSKYSTYAFTEQGIAMLSGILKSDHAIHINIAIIRTFVQMRRLIQTHKELTKKIEEMELKYDERFALVFKTIKQLIQQKSEVRKRIGFKYKKLL